MRFSAPPRSNWPPPGATAIALTVRRAAVPAAYTDTARSEPSTRWTAKSAMEPGPGAGLVGGLGVGGGVLAPGAAGPGQLRVAAHLVALLDRRPAGQAVEHVRGHVVVLDPASLDRPGQGPRVGLVLGHRPGQGDPGASGPAVAAAPLGLVQRHLGARPGHGHLQLVAGLAPAERPVAAADGPADRFHGPAGGGPGRGTHDDAGASVRLGHRDEPGAAVHRPLLGAAGHQASSTIGRSVDGASTRPSA